MRTTIYTIVTFATISLVSCNTGWNDEHKKTYMDACTPKLVESFGEEKAKEYCACTMEKMMEKYPNPADAGKVTNEEATKMAAECL